MAAGENQKLKMQNVKKLMKKLKLKKKQNKMQYKKKQMLKINSKMTCVKS